MLVASGPLGLAFLKKKPKINFISSENKKSYLTPTFQPLL